MSIVDKVQQYVSYRRVFCTHRDVQRYRQLRDRAQIGDPVVTLALREAMSPQTCRPHTMDAITLWDAFGSQFHLPAWPLADGLEILDLGANAGYTAAHLAYRYPMARIVGVELDADNVALAVTNTRAGRIHIVHGGLWHESGTIRYGGSRVHEYAIGTGLREAPAVTPADLVARFGLTRIAYCKMDIEGAEATVLPALLDTVLVDQIQVEVHPPATLADCTRVLTSRGFRVQPHAAHPSSLNAIRLTSTAEEK